MQKKFYSSVILIVLLNLLVKPFYLFGIDAQIQNEVGAEQYGMYFSLLNFSFLFNMILDLGITNYNAKNIAEHPNIVKRYIGPIIGIKLLLGIFYAFFTLGVALLLGYNDLQMGILGMLVLNQFLAGLILYFRSNFAGLHIFRIDAVLSVLDRVLLIGICLVLLYGGITEKPFQIEWFVYAQTAAYGLTVAFGFIMSVWKIGLSKIKIKRLYSYAILKKSTPFALLILLMMLYTRIDAVMLERMLPDGKYQAGIYAQGFRLLDAANIFGLLIAGLLLPMFARLIKERESIIELVKAAAALLIGVSLLVGISASFFSYDLMNMIYREHVAETTTVFPWIILSFIPICAAYVFGTLLTASGNLRLLNRVAFAGIFINVGLNLLFIPLYKAEGAAIATFITQIIAGIGQVVLAILMFRLNWNYRLLAKLSVFVLLLMGIGFINRFFLENTGIMFFILFTAIGIMLLFVLKIIHLKEILLILKEKM
jgi:O-antigen/teichoic acid export membrane protein